MYTGWHCYEAKEIHGHATQDQENVKPFSAGLHVSKGLKNANFAGSSGQETQNFFYNFLSVLYRKRIK